MSTFLPQGPFQWVALSVGAVAVVVALTRIPLRVWARHKWLTGSLVCVIAAILGSEFFDLSADVTIWLVGVTATVFIAVVVFSGVRLIRQLVKRSQEL